MRRFAFALLLAGCASQSPAPSQEPGVVTGADGLTKRVVYRNAELAPITSVSKNGAGMHVIGRSGAVVLDDGGTPRATVTFEESGGETVAVDIDRDGVSEYVNRGGGWQQVSVIGSDGRTKWKYPQRRTLFGGAPNTMAFGDLDQDGKLEFVVGMNGGGGVIVLDEHGTVLRKTAGANVFSLEIADIIPGGALEVLHSKERSVDVRAADGTLLTNIPLPSYSFTLLQRGPPMFVCVDAGGSAHTLRLIDVNGSIRGSYLLPDRGHVRANAAGVATGSKPLLVAWRTLRATGHRSALYVFEADGTLRYHEIFEAPSITVSAPADAPGTFYVGANETVWQYGIATTSPKK